MKRLAVLGSTGTIGCQTLDIVDRFPDQFRVVSLAAGRNIQRLVEQIDRYRPERVSVQSDAEIPELERRFPAVDFFHGDDGVLACLDGGVDLTVLGIVGFAGLAPTLFAIERGIDIALANKESLVVGGGLVKRALQKSKSRLIPVDSEHNALFQLCEGRRKEEIESVVLTASGGPFWNHPELDLSTVTPERAIAHPNWKMGPKISVDSATLMNKGLEVIEAHVLFELPSERIEVWVHPQSIVHGAIWFTDNTCLAQLSKPDMRASIGYALSYPERLPRVVPKLDLKQMARLEFQEPDTKRFPALALARRAMESGESHLVALNAANEVAVDAFLKGQIPFTGIPAHLERVLAAHKAVSIDSLSTLVALDRAVRLG